MDGSHENACWSKGLEGNFVARLCQAVNQVALECLAVQFIKIVGTKILVRLAALQDVVGDDQDAMRDRHQSALLASPAHQTMELRRKISVFSMTGPMSRFRQGELQPAIAFAGLAAVEIGRASCRERV